MSNDTRKLRLTREAIGGAEGEMPVGQGTLLAIAALLAILLAAAA
jgi:hypothetical protein